MHILPTTAGQSSPGSSGDAVDPDVGAAPLHSGAATGEGHSPDLCTASQHQRGQISLLQHRPGVCTHSLYMSIKYYRREKHKTQKRYWNTKEPWTLLLWMRNKS